MGREVAVIGLAVEIEEEDTGAAAPTDVASQEATVEVVALPKNAPTAGVVAVLKVPAL